MVSGIKAVIGVSGKACVSQRNLYVAQTGSNSTFATPCWKVVKKILKPTYDGKKGSFFFLQRSDISPVFSIENYLPAIKVGDWRNS